MIPPRRSRKARATFQPNSPPEGLNVYNEAPPLRDERAISVNRLFRDVLKPKGWVFYRRGSKDDFSFIPTSLLGNREDAALVFKFGAEGTHYACGWLGLHEMVQEHGEDYAPARLPQQEPLKANLSNDKRDKYMADTASYRTNSSEDENDNDEVNEQRQMNAAVGLTRRKEPSGRVRFLRATSNRQQQSVDSEEDTDIEDDSSRMAAVEDGWMRDNESDFEGQGHLATEVGHTIKQEDDEFGSADVENSGEESNDSGAVGSLFETSSIQNLSATLDCIRKCREEFCWLETHPDFLDQDTTNACKDELLATTVNLYSQIYTLNHANESDDD